MSEDDGSGRQTEAERFYVLTRSLLDAGSAPDVLDRIKAAAEVMIPDADLIGVSELHTDDDCGFPVAVAEEARFLDKIQYETGQGPCVEVTEPGGPAYVLDPDLKEDGRWPALESAATDRGYTAALSVVVGGDSDAVGFNGALSFYARPGSRLAAPARDTALLLSTHSTLALAKVHTREQDHRTAANLRAAVAGRDVIGQAKGVLMERYGLRAPESFRALSQTSQQLNIRLTQLAAVVVDGHRRPVQDAGAGQGETIGAEVRGQRAKPDDPIGNPEAPDGFDEAAAPAGQSGQSGQRTIESCLSSAAAHDRLADQLERQAASRPDRGLVLLGNAAYHRGLATRDRDQAAALVNPTP